MKVVVAVVALLCIVYTVQGEILSNGWNADAVVRGDQTGRILFVAGELGVLKQSPLALTSYMRNVSQLLGASVDHSTFVLKRTDFDAAGNAHIRMQQMHRGLEVDGGEVIIHVNHTGDAVFALTCSVLLDEDVAEDFERGLRAPYDPIQAIKNVAPSTQFSVVEGTTASVFVVHEERAFYAYRAEIAYVEEDGNEVNATVYAEIDDGTPIAVFPLTQPALNRLIYNTANSNRLPGTTARTEGGAKSSDKVVNEAYDNSGSCYNFYFKTFGRDSYNGRGAQLKSTVHYGVGYNNAFWNGAQMVYGDGDGRVFSDFAQDLSVVCHELSHAWTSSTSNLRYSGESGALNEGMSDVMGASSQMFVSGKVNTQGFWIGKECYLQGAALRYMNNPTQDGSSRDYYPERYTGILDNGGVHWNSGICNLAYYLLVQGGQHPRKKTNTIVTAVGISKGQQIFYSTNTNYLTSTSNFSAAKAASITAAKALGYTASVQQSTSDCWTAVGVN